MAKEYNIDAPRFMQLAVNQLGFKMAYANKYKDGRATAANQLFIAQQPHK
jgi:hypothetical protein